MLNRFFGMNSSRVRLYQENERFAEQVPPGAMVLDAGAGEAPYKPLFAHARYESADFEQVDKPYAHSTYVCDLRKIPVEANRYDFIIFNQVMEHLPEPEAVLQEFYRILKSGGRIIYTAPLFYEEHEVPYDFYRYTSYGVRYLFQKTGFIVEQLDWLEGYFGTVAYQMGCFSRYLPVCPAKIAPSFLGYIAWPLVALLKFQACFFELFFHWLETISKYTDRGYPKNYVAIIQKPESDDTSDK